MFLKINSLVRVKYLQRALDYTAGTLSGSLGSSRLDLVDILNSWKRQINDLINLAC
jgi:hypothetical protein